MVSGFICSCHGFMNDGALKGFELFEPGKKNGYWTNKYLVEQVQGLMPQFESLHQNSELVIVFDNSQNHHMTKDDGLDAGFLNLSKPKRVSTPIREGYFMRDGERVTQQMMENGPSPEAFEAQVVLDRILRMITEIRDVEEIQ